MMRLRRVTVLTSAGNKVGLWTRRGVRVPRVPKNVLECAAYLYRSKEDALQGANEGASAFFVGVPFDAEEPLVNAPLFEPLALDLRRWRAEWQEVPDHFYLVTCNHVCGGGGNFLRLNLVDGGTEVVELDPNDWHRHETYDLAVQPIAPNRSHQQIRCVPQEMLLTEQIAEELEVGIGDDVFTVGRFSGLAGQHQNLPTARFGHVAQMPQEEHALPPYKVKSFIVDCRSISGFSGSPVFLHLHPWEVEWDSDGRKAARQKVPWEAWLLGVDWGHFHAPGDKGTNTGMMGVTPAWKLLELLNCEELREARSETRAVWERGRTTSFD